MQMRRKVVFDFGYSIIVTLFGFALVASVGGRDARAAPFLVSDPSAAAEEVSSYVVDIDGTEYPNQVPQPVEGSGPRLYMDLAPLGLAAGQHTAKAKACNSVGCSGWSAEYTGVMSAPFAPGGVGVQP